MFEVKLTTQAERAYQHLTKVVQERVDRILETFEEGNFRHRNIKALTGPYAGSLRYRIGDWRIVFRVDHKHHIVWIEAITTRGGAYHGS